jgi:fructosamine-3-kinase
VDFAKALANLTGTAASPRIEVALGDVWSANTLATVQKAPQQLQPALLLGSPEFLYY